MIEEIGENEIIYIVGSISDDPKYKSKFRNAEERLRALGYKYIINPTCVADNLPYTCYAPISIGFVNACTVLYVLEGYEASKGVCAEMSYAIMSGKKIVMEVKDGNKD